MVVENPYQYRWVSEIVRLREPEWISIFAGSDSWEYVRLHCPQNLCVRIFIAAGHLRRCQCLACLDTADSHTYSRILECVSPMVPIHMNCPCNGCTQSGNIPCLLIAVRGSETYRTQAARIAQVPVVSTTRRYKFLVGRLGAAPGGCDPIASAKCAQRRISFQPLSFASTEGKEGGDPK
jgi:hypothetical protein